MTSVALLFLFPMWCGQAPGDLLRPADAGETVDRFAVASLIVEGARAYPPEEIARAVAHSPRFLIASHPCASLAHYLDYVEETVRLGYLHGGFAEVKVETLPDRERTAVHIAVEEGPRFKAGPVVVEGNQALSSEAVVAVLTQPRLNPEPDDPEKQTDPLWKPGEPAPLDPWSLRRAVTLVEYAYARAGHLGTRVEVGPRREGEMASLAIRVLDEGAPSTLGEVRFQGRFTDDPEEVKRAVGIRPGMALDQAVRDSLQVKLAALGRYVEPKVRVVPAKEGGKADLEIEIWQALFAPTFGEPAPVQQAVLRKAFEWLGDAGRWRGPLTFRADAATYLRDLGLVRWIESASLEAAVSVSSLLVEARYQRKDAGVERIGCILDGHRGILIAAPLRLVSRFDVNGGAVLRGKIRISAVDPRELQSAEDSQLKLNLGMSVRPRRNAAEPGFGIQVGVSETALTYVARRQELAYVTDGGFLRVDHLPEAGERQRIASIHGETGEVELELKKQVDGVAVSLSFEEMGIAERVAAAHEEARTNAYEEVSPVRLLALAAVGGARLRQFVHGRREDAQVRVLEPLFQNLLRNEEETARYLAGLFAAGSRDATEKAFTIPWEPLEGKDRDCCQMAIAGVLGAAASLLAADMPRGSWLEAFLREAAAVALGSTTYTQAEIRRILNSPEVGPVGYWAFAEGLCFAGMADLSRTFAKEALHQGAAGFRKDLEVFRRPGGLPARVLTALGKAVQDLEPATVESLGSEAERLGDDGEREFVRLLEQARAEKDPAAAGALLLEAYWQTGLSAALRERCEELSG